MRGKDRARGKRYRDNFVAAHLSTNTAAQIQTMREARGWMQKDLAAKAKMSPARISVLENPSYENLNVRTLKRIASAFDVALLVKFAAFSELVNHVANLSPDKLNVAGFEDDSLSDLPEGTQDDTKGQQLSKNLEEPQIDHLAPIQLERVQQPQSALEIQLSSTAAASGQIRTSLLDAPPLGLLPSDLGRVQSSQHLTA